MKRVRRSFRVFAIALGLAVLLLSPALPAQTTTTGVTSPPGGANNFNPPPFDFNDNFYTENGISVTQLDLPQSARFGIFRRTGPPARDGQVNWVIDNSNTEPTHNNVRILATTGGYKDDTGTATEFISIIAFAMNQNFFNGVANKRGILMHDIVGDFEAYAAIKQRKPDGTFFTRPCLASQGVTTNCFSVASVATPTLRQDWRFATNRNGIDGSSGGGFGYFCDDLLGMWIITYFWYTDAAVGPHPTAGCKTQLQTLAARNGLGLDGTPIVRTGDELNNELEAFGCADETALDEGGADGGPVWLVCPAIPDPTNGAIARDAFLDAVRRNDGSFVDPKFAKNFACLQSDGREFCTQ